MEITIVLPGPGDVVVGSVVPVAGSVAVSGAPRGIGRPHEVSVTISDGAAILGQATLPVIDGRYAGWIRVSAPRRGVVAEIQVCDQSRVTPVVASLEVVLQAGGSDGVE
ncbi:MAG: hypothetical protein L0227_19075 [Chloroflexi bacterium]|nr:hypothetical protein [Chloroflexota bacterium]